MAPNSRIPCFYEGPHEGTSRTETPYEIGGENAQRCLRPCEAPEEALAWFDVLLSQTCVFSRLVLGW